jgi:hypothetical protein
MHETGIQRMTVAPLPWVSRDSFLIGYAAFEDQGRIPVAPKALAQPVDGRSIHHNR